LDTNAPDLLAQGDGARAAQRILVSSTTRSEVQAGIALDPTFTISRFHAGASSDNPTYLAQRKRIAMACV